MASLPPAADPQPASDISQSAEHSDHATQHGSTAALTLAAIGVVYGDIGTSPLYALRESLSHAHEEGMAETAVVGIISLLIWTVMLIVTLKYVLLILRADNNGEGGTLSLVAKASEALGNRSGKLLLIGIVGVSLFFGDAMITPAISVMSAVEGLELVLPAADNLVVPVTLAVVFVLFWVQRSGTGRVARFFGPIMVIWFLVMAGLGLSHIADDGRILRALNPYYAGEFLLTKGYAALPVLGSVFLAVTGAEALYADMGHFGRRPVRIAWGALVLPALLLAYLGQGAMVLARPETAANPFFLMVPDWFTLPLILLATLATVIASQAVISGAFSVAQQAVQLGLIPRLEIRHTSETQRGQIYMPRVNVVLLIGVVALVLAFQSSAALANAYGIAVTGDMVITSLLAVVVFRWAWGWRWWAIALVMVPILSIEMIFLTANLIKVFDGGWIPLVLAAMMVTLMVVWRRGSAAVQRRISSDSVPLGLIAEKLTAREPRIVPGTAVFLTADPDTAPPALMHNLKHNHVLHERNFVVRVVTSNGPRVADGSRLRMEQVGPRFWRVWLTFGYTEQPNVPRALTEARRQGHKFDIMSTSFFLNRRSLRVGQGRLMPNWMARVYAGLYRTGSEPTNFYRLPSNRVVELGQQINL
ncbi:MAG: potassium transporter Kup [Paracoccus sp. (in: a-proteobacteria)]|uniref:potassium transporter Kup n=1 Tax=Paracoccus sp. TaxID=267 RepID=UPI0026E06BD6|nr:potassium transporter Kup [Paracoccus sp. (in: a-proteobacteria)]MDO5622014.1 potassium transporter Kup [Paracoccus sp. (in: a-proteobacteria)]